MNGQNSFRAFTWLALVAAAGAAVALYAFALNFGNLNQDEGWYLYAAQCVARGAVPYRDFFFTQGPVLPCVYGALAGLWSPHGVLGGRCLTLAFGFLACVMTALLARRASPRERAMEAGVLAFALTACNLYHAYFTTIPKTYGLASFLVMAGFLLLSLCVPREPKTRSMRTAMWALPAGLLIALAAGTRLSLGALLPVTALGLLLTCRKTGAAFFWFALGGALGLLLVFGPPLTEAREQFMFAQTFHASRLGGGHDVFLVAGSLSRSVRAYLPMAMMAAALVLLAPLGRRTGATAGGMWAWLWLAGFLSVFLLHLAGPFPYDDYQVPVMGLLAAALAAWTVRSALGAIACGSLCLFWVAVALAAAFGSPLPQEWMLSRQDRFWAVRKPAPDLALLRRVAREARALSGEAEAMLLTQEAYLAVEAGMRVPEGLEMGPFAYFPELPDEDAAKFHVLNKRMLLALLERAPCEVAAVSGYGFAIRAPVMDRVPEDDVQLFWSRLTRSYDRVDEVADFGQHCTTLQVFKRRPGLLPPMEETPAPAPAAEPPAPAPEEAPAPAEAPAEAPAPAPAEAPAPAPAEAPPPAPAPAPAAEAVAP